MHIGFLRLRRLIIKYITIETVQHIYAYVEWFFFIIV